MYAIIETGGKQYKVQPGQVIEVEKLEAKSDTVTFDRVLLCVDGENVQVGTPTIPEAKVIGAILGATKAQKVVAFKKRRRKDSQWTRGHRQALTRVRIDRIAAA